MDKIKEKIDEIVKKVTSDKSFAEIFKKDPIKAVESVLGIDLPDETIKKIVDGVKAKINMDTAKDVLDKVKGLFN